jgi:hypothetical protein
MCGILFLTLIIFSSLSFADCSDCGKNWWKLDFCSKEKCDQLTTDGLPCVFKQDYFSSKCYPFEIAVEKGLIEEDGSTIIESANLNTSVHFSDKKIIYIETKNNQTNSPIRIDKINNLTNGLSIFSNGLFKSFLIIGTAINLLFIAIMAMLAYYKPAIRSKIKTAIIILAIMIVFLWTFPTILDIVTSAV